jgi:hypothetical protein
MWLHQCTVSLAGPKSLSGRLMGLKDHGIMVASTEYRIHVVKLQHKYIICVSLQLLET